MKKTVHPDWRENKKLAEAWPEECTEDKCVNPHHATGWCPSQPRHECSKCPPTHELLGLRSDQLHVLTFPEEK